MPLPSSGPINFSEIQTEFGGSNPIGLGEYYAGGSFVSAGTSGNSGAIPSSGALPIGRFFGSAAAGIVWGPRFLRPSGRVRFFNNRFFIVGKAFSPISSSYNTGATITYSSDFTGTSWTTVRLPTDANTTISDIAWNGTTYVAVGRSLYSSTNSIITSPDLINWTPRNVDLGSPERGPSITTNNNLFVVTSAGNKLLTSPDGVTWTTVFVTNDLYDIIWNGFTFVGVGRTLAVYSTNGTSWSPGNGIGTSNFDDKLYSVTWGNNIFVATTSRGSYSYTSPNGVTWTKRTHPSLQGGGTSVSFGNGVFLQLGVFGDSLTSTDGITWTSRGYLGSSTGGISGTGVSNPTAMNPSSLFGGDRFIATNSQGAVSSSTDALNWISLTSGALPLDDGVRTFGQTEDFALYSAASNGNTIVAVGAYGRNSFNKLTERPTIITSVDGNNWTHVNTNALTTLRWSLQDVIWTGNRFIASGGNLKNISSSSALGQLILTSDNGSTWTSRVEVSNVSFQDTPIISIAYKGNRVVASSQSLNRAWISDDGGINWTFWLASGLGGTSAGIASNGSIFITIQNGQGSPSYCYVSSDGQTPITSTSQGVVIPVPNNGTVIRRVRWVNDRFIVCGRISVTGGNIGMIRYSSDGITWNSASIPEATVASGITTIYDVNYSFGKYFAVSNRGIFSSTDGVNFSLLSGYSNTTTNGVVPLYGITNLSNKIIAVGREGSVITSPPPNATTL